MEKIHKNIRVFMLSCIKHACFHIFSPFSAYFSPHDIIAEKGLQIFGRPLHVNLKGLNKLLFNDDVAVPQYLRILEIATQFHNALRNLKNTNS